MIEGGGAGEACVVQRRLSRRTIGKAGPRLATRCCLLPHLLLMLLHEGELVLQLLQHLHLGGLEVCSVGPQVIQVLELLWR